MFKIFLCTNSFCTLLWNFINLYITQAEPQAFGCSIIVNSAVTKVHLLQKFLDPQKHALIDNILPTGGNLSRFSFTWKMWVVHTVYTGKYVSTFVKGKTTRGFARWLTTYKYENEKARLDKNLHRRVRH
jgi:hypothetical protein